jgi:hypothetical protein
MRFTFHFKKIAEDVLNLLGHFTTYNEYTFVFQVSVFFVKNITYSDGTRIKIYITNMT